MGVLSRRAQCNVQFAPLLLLTKQYEIRNPR